MNRVMVDNWMLYEVLRYLEDPETQPGQAYGALLSALVLWDEVCYPDNERSRWKALGGPLADCLTPLEDRSDALEDASVRMMIGMVEEQGFPDPYFLWLRDREHVVNAMALRYLLFSAQHGCDYLPASRRQSFLREHGTPGQMQKVLLRMKMMRQLDEKAEAYYQEAYRGLLELSELELTMPVLADFIRSGAPAGVDPLEYALHLRQEGPAVRYRAYLAQLEQALEIQDWKELRRLLRASQDTVAEVIALDRKRLGGVTVKLLPTPSVAVNYGRFKGELSPAPSFSFDGDLARGGRKLHLSFLRELTDFAVNRRKLF